MLRDRSGWASNAESGSMGATGIASLLAINRRLCAADNCTYLRFDAAYKNIEPHWRKVFIGSYVLNTTSSCAAVAWIDSDAVLSSRPSDLLSLLHPRLSTTNTVEQAEDRRYKYPPGAQRVARINRNEIHFAAAGEADLYNHNLSPFNAGVWVVANTKIGRSIMNHWVQAYTNHAAARWTRDPTGKHTGQDDLSWRCTQPDESNPRRTRPCTFSQEYYEQGAFVKHVLGGPNARLKHAIRLVPWHVLQSPHPHPMVHHFTGPPRTKDRYMGAWMGLRGGAAEGDHR